MLQIFTQEGRLKKKKKIFRKISFFNIKSIKCFKLTFYLVTNI